MADGIRATPYRYPVVGTANDIIGGLLGYLRDPRRTQQMQGLAGLLESTGIPKTVERLAYGEPLTNLQQANVPALRPETAEALLTLLPVPAGANRAAMAAGRAGERMAERVVPQIMERGGMPAGLLEGMSSRTVSPLTVYHGSPANEVIAPTSLLESAAKNFESSVTDASEIFGQGAKRIKYTDPNSGGVIDVLQRPDGTASVLGLEVPEAMRGQGIGQSLQSQVMQDFPEMMGQVSSRAAAKTAYRLGRRPPNQPDATLDDVYKIMDEYSSVNLVSPEMQKRFNQSLLD